MKFILLTLFVCATQVFADTAVPANSADQGVLAPLFEIADPTTRELLEVYGQKIQQILSENEHLQQIVTPELEKALVQMLAGVEAHSDAGRITVGVIIVTAEIIVDAYELALVYKKCEAITDPAQQGVCFTRFSIKILTSINEIRLTIKSFIKPSSATSVVLPQQMDKFYEDFFGNTLLKLQESN